MFLLWGLKQYAGLHGRLETEPFDKKLIKHPCAILGSACSSTKYILGRPSKGRIQRKLYHQECMHFAQGGVTGDEIPVSPSALLCRLIKWKKAMKTRMRQHRKSHLLGCFWFG